MRTFWFIIDKHGATAHSGNGAAPFEPGMVAQLCRDWDAQFPGTAPHRLLQVQIAEPSDAAEILRLQQWKAEAMEVLAKWDKVHEALGSPAALGQSTAVASAARATALAALVDDLQRMRHVHWLDDALTHHGFIGET